MGRFASYREYGEKFWRVGYGSQQVFGRAVSMHDKLYTNEIEEQLEKDLEIFSEPPSAACAQPRTVSSVKES